MKNIFKVFGIIALVAVIGFSMISCDDGNGDSGFVATVYKLIATASGDAGGNTFKTALDFNMTDQDGRSARAISGGTYDYRLLLGEVGINEGTVTFANGVYSFAPNGASSFSYNTNTGDFTGSIPISAATKAAINATFGDDGLEHVILPDSLSIDGIVEAKINPSGGYWNGTWNRYRQDGEPEGTQKIVFNGSNYTLTRRDGTTETGTFVYFEPDESEEFYMSPVFIFSRNVTSGPKVAAYLFEGAGKPITIGDEVIEPMLELYNWMNDPMDIALDFTESNELYYIYSDLVEAKGADYAPWDEAEIEAWRNSTDSEVVAAYDAWKEVDDATPRMFFKQ